MDEHCVYWIHLSEQRDPYTEGYVGFTANAEKRWRSHRRGKGKAFRLQAAFKEYGVDNFLFEVLADGLTKCAACHLERVYRPRRNIGYNIGIGGYCKPMRKARDEFAISVKMLCETLNTIAEQ